MQFQFKTTTDDWSMKCTVMQGSSGREIAPNTGAITTKFFTLATKSRKLVAKLATRMFRHNLT